jgi:cytoskeletal protein RodZ
MRMAGMSTDRGGGTGSQLDFVERDNFGLWLRHAREDRGASLGEVSASTKVSQSTLTMLEAGKLEQLPAEVFVRGFIRSYARAVGVDDTRPLALYERALEARRDAERAQSKTPVIDPVFSGPMGEDEAPRSTLGLAVFVIILLLIATITLSLLLRRPPQSGEGLSERATPAAETATLAALSRPGHQRP